MRLKNANKLAAQWIPRLLYIGSVIWIIAADTLYLTNVRELKALAELTPLWLFGLLKYFIYLICWWASTKIFSNALLLFILWPFNSTTHEFPTWNSKIKECKPIWWIKYNVVKCECKILIFCYLTQL